MTFYPDPRPTAEAIRGRVAFWHGVRIKADGDGDDDDAGLLARLRHRLRG